MLINTWSSLKRGGHPKKKGFHFPLWLFVSELTPHSVLAIALLPEAMTSFGPEVFSHINLCHFSWPVSEPALSAIGTVSFLWEIFAHLCLKLDTTLLCFPCFSLNLKNFRFFSLSTTLILCGSWGMFPFWLFLSSFDEVHLLIIK